jgi:NAD(P)-dependent dehydrogenase (short-subunit alcohol dehydrogenase family)
LGHNIEGKVVVITGASSKLGALFARTVIAHTSSGEETLAKKVPSARLVAAFSLPGQRSREESRRDADP